MAADSRQPPSASFAVKMQPALESSRELSTSALFFWQQRHCVRQCKVHSPQLEEGILTTLRTKSLDNCGTIGVCWHNYAAGRSHSAAGLINRTLNKRLVRMLGSTETSVMHIHLLRLGFGAGVIFPCMGNILGVILFLRGPWHSGNSLLVIAATSCRLRECSKDSWQGRHSRSFWRGLGLLQIGRKLTRAFVPLR